MTRAVAGASSLRRYSPVHVLHVKYTGVSHRGYGAAVRGKDGDRTNGRVNVREKQRRRGTETESRDGDPRRKTPHVPCYARTTRLCHRCCPRSPPILALVRLCISVIRLALYTRLCRTTEEIWRTTYAPQTVHTRTHTHTYTPPQRTHIYRTENRPTVSRLGSWLSPRRRASLSLSSSSVFVPLPLSLLEPLDFGISPSRRLGIFCFFPREETPNRPAAMRSALCASSDKNSGRQVSARTSRERYRFSMRDTARNFDTIVPRIGTRAETRIYCSEWLLTSHGLTSKCLTSLTFSMLISVD